MNKFECTLSKIAFTKVTAFLGKCFYRKSFKIFFYIFLCKNLFPLPCDPILPPGNHDLNKFETSLPDDASKQLVPAFLPKWFLRRFLKIYTIYSYVKLRPPIVAQPYPWGSWFSQLWIYTTWGCIHTSFSFPGQKYHDKTIFENFSKIFMNF